MLAYIARRIFFMIPTLFGILLINFVIVQFAPGGPVERIIAQLQGAEAGETARFGGGGEKGGGGRRGGGRGVRRAALQGGAIILPNTGAPKGSTPSSSLNSKSNSASTSPPMSASL